jgi:uncharacterized protein YerC
MTKVSRRKLELTTRQKLERRLWEAVGKTENTGEAKEFWGRILTPTEVIMLAKRLEVLKLLRKGKSYSEISDSLNVMPNTINRMSNLLHRCGRRFFQILSALGS